MALTKNLEGSNRDFWKVASEAHTIIETKWPKWMKEIRVTKYSVGFTSETPKNNGKLNHKRK